MKIGKIYKTLLFLILLTISLSKGASSVFAEDRWIRVKSPNGGETFKVGETHTISWESSANIDKVAIGYSFGPGSLNWIAFTYPNTGSYSWNVNIGNTSNTQVKIDITGYETGKGSTTDQSDSFFTVLQNQSQPTLPPSYPTSPSYPTGSAKGSSNYPWPTYFYRFLPTSKPILRPTPIPLTYKTVTLWSIFYFEGSLTTDLSKLTDAAHVKDFTLDTKEGWTFVFSEELNLTDPKKLQALQNIKNYWVVESWFIWIKIEWWEMVKTPLKFTFKNEKLTGFAPHLAVSEDKKETKVAVVKSQPGKLEADLSGGGKVEIKPKVELLGEKEVKTNNNSYPLKGHSSHKDLQYQLKINGKEQKTDLTNFNQETGEFEIKLENLIKGANFVQLSFREKENDEWQTAGEKTILVQSFFESVGKYVLIGLTILTALLLVLGSGIFLEKKFQLSKKIAKIFKKMK